MAQPYEDRLAQLESLSDEDVTQLEQDIIATFDEADQADDLDTMSATADALDQVRAEMEKRGLAGESSENPAEEATETPADESAEPVAASAEAEPVVDAESEPDPESAPEDNPDGDVAGDNSEEGTEDAAVDIPEDRKPVVTASAVKVTAGADIPGYSAGSEFGSMEEVSQAFVRRLDSIRRATGGDGDQHLVATIVATAGEDRQLNPNDPEGNWEKIRKVTSPEAITAAGGWCAPLETKYDIFGLGSAARPVRDALAGFQASRGGIRFTEPPKLGDNAAAVGLWTAAVDAAPAAAVKAFLAIECAPEQTATVDAVTLQLEFGNLMARAFPELVTRNNELALIEHARLGELTLLSKIGAASTAVTSAFTLGVARDFLLSIGRAAAAYRSRHRMERTDPLRVIAPAWVLDAMREDLAYGLPGDHLAAADSEISGYLSARNVSISWHMDDAFPAQAAGALVDFPTTIVWYLFAEGTFLFLDGGTLDLGIVRDSALVSTNDYRMFVETFEGVAKVGIESIKVTTTTHIAGGVAGTVDTVA
jgi:hypothetical protein